MRRSFPLSSLTGSLFAGALLLGGLLSGCVVVHDHPRPVTPVATCAVPTFDNFQGNYPAFGIAPGASTEISPGDSAFAMTANGNGTFRLTWSDTNGLSTCFTGLITGLTPFSTSQVSGFSGYETFQFNRANQIAFASIPGANVDGIDFFAAQDPVYIDAFADNSAAVNIYFTSSATGLVSTTGANPAAFSSP